MDGPIRTLTIKGFKSIRSLEGFRLGDLNILIGANGSGKSNFVSFFSLVRAIVRQEMQLDVEKQGGADAHLYLGPKVTKEIVGKLYFELSGYEFTLQPTIESRLVFAEELVHFKGPSYGEDRGPLGKGHSESKLPGKKDQTLESGGPASPYFVSDAVSSWMVYHFHDTSDTAPMRRKGTTGHYGELEDDAGNLAAFLLRLREHEGSTYTLIRDTTRLVAPFFDDFKLRPEPSGADTSVQLEWTQKGSSYPFHPSQLSDGTLRFICLATALLQPDPPATILLDEPELGLHPYALSVLAGLLKQAASRTQVIVSTQSATLLDHFEPEDVIVVRRDKGESKFERLSAKDLSEWLNDYSMGEIWQKNVVDGGPVHE